MTLKVSNNYWSERGNKFSLELDDVIKDLLIFFFVVVDTKPKEDHIPNACEISSKMELCGTTTILKGDCDYTLTLPDDCEVTVKRLPSKKFRLYLPSDGLDEEDIQRGDR